MDHPISSKSQRSRFHLCSRRASPSIRERICTHSCGRIACGKACGKGRERRTLRREVTTIGARLVSPSLLDYHRDARGRPSLSPGRVPGRVSEVAALAHSEWRSDICRHGDVSQGYIAKLEPSNRTGKSKTVRKNNPSVAILK